MTRDLWLQASFLLFIMAGCFCGKTAQKQPQPETFSIVLHRCVKSGDQFRRTTKVNRIQKQSVSIASQPTKTKVIQRQLDFSAMAKVLVADRLGNETTTLYTIEHFFATVDGQQEVVLQPETVLTVVRGDPPQLRVSPGLLNEQTKSDIRAVVSTSSPKAITDDDVFGTKVPQTIGASWPINAQTAAQGLSDDDIQVQPAGLSGHTRLVGRRMEKGLDCLEISAQFLAASIGLTQLPSSSQVQQASMEFGLTGFFPTDSNKQMVKGTTTSNAHFLINFNMLGQEAQMEMTMTETEVKVVTPLQ